jgi:hypothetical protein
MPYIIRFTAGVALKILKVTPREAIGYGLSKEDAQRLEAIAT